MRRALDVYRDARTVLVDEFGIEPRRELRDLQQAILTERGSPVERDRAAFFGRTRELDELARASRTRLRDAGACSCSSANPESARVAWLTSWSRRRGRAEHAFWSDAAGRRGARQRTGLGCRRYGHESGPPSPVP